MSTDDSGARAVASASEQAHGAEAPWIPTIRRPGPGSPSSAVEPWEQAPQRPSITAVLWDFGGVLSSSPFEAFARYEAEHGLPRGFIRSVNATDPDSNAWARLERNELDLDGFDAAFASESAALGHRVAGRDVLGLLAGDLRPEMIRAVRRCRTHGLRTALLTNNVVAMDGWEAGVALDELFDVVVESSKAGVRKPDRAAYDLVLGALGVPAEEVVFLDDLGINLKPARAMGMTTVKVSDPEQALSELEAALGLPLR